MSVIKLRNIARSTLADPGTKLEDLPLGTVFRFHNGLLVKLSAGDGVTVITANAVTVVLVPMGGIYTRYETGRTFTMSKSTIIKAHDIVENAWMDVEYRA